ncbi:MAG: WG repeat-containing protein, partial [Ignavibacteriaceae bacterium]
FFNNKVRLKCNGRMGVLDNYNKQIVPFNYDWIGEYGVEGYAPEVIFNTHIEQIYIKGKVGLINEVGIEIVFPKFDKIGLFIKDLAKVEIEGNFGFQYGIIHSSGKEILSCIYDSISDFKNGFAYFKKKDKYGCINENGEIVIKCLYDEVQEIKFGIGIVRKNDKYGCLDTRGNEVLSCCYGFIYITNNKLIEVKKGDKTGFVNHQGFEITHVTYDKIYKRLENFYIVEVNDKKGLFDCTKGQEILPCIYEDIGSYFGGGYAIITFDKPQIFSSRLNRKWGAVNLFGETIIPCQYEIISEYSEGLFCAGINDKWGYINNSNKTLMPFIYDWAYPFKNGIAKIKKDGNFGLINTFGKPVVECIFDKIEKLNLADYDFIEVKKNGKSGIINSSGIFLFPCIYDKLSVGVETLFHKATSFVLLNIDGYYGISDLNHRMIVPILFDEIEISDEGYFKVKKNEKYGLYKYNGEEIVSCKYGYIGKVHYRDIFEGDFATVYNDQKMGLINREGREVLPCKYSHIFLYTKDVACARIIPGDSTKEEYLLMQGNEVIPLKYDHIADDYGCLFDNGLAKVNINGKDGYINSFREEFWEN